MMIIDRFEENFAVLETDNGMDIVPRTALPANAKEGDLLCETAQGYTIDAAATLARREQLLARTKKRKET